MMQLLITGNLGDKAKKITSKDKQYLAFEVGCRNYKTGGSNGNTNATEWISCVMNHSAFFEKALVKGAKVLLQGSPRFKTYQSDKSCKVDISLFVDSIELLDSRGKSE